MKNKTTSATTTAPALRLSNAQIEAQDNNHREHLKRCQEIRDERAAKILSEIESVFYFEGSPVGNIGFGFRRDGQLVEFYIPEAGGCDDIEDASSVTNISLSDSITWTLNMNYAESRISSSMQFGPAFSQWLKLLGFAVLKAE